MPFRLGPPEIILILVIFFIIFGAGRLPQVGEFLGKGLRVFRRGKTAEEEPAPKKAKRSSSRS